MLFNKSLKLESLWCCKVHRRKLGTKKLEEYKIDFMMINLSNLL